MQDNIAKIYYGKADNFPDEFELTNLDISALTSDYLDNNKFDFIIIENSSMDSVLSDDVYQKLVTLANGKQYIIFDGTNVIEKKNDEGGNLWLATYANGAYCYNVNEKRWKNYVHNDEEEESVRTFRPLLSRDFLFVIPMIITILRIPIRVFRRAAIPVLSRSFWRVSRFA